jgi:hypothetical protein
LGEPVSRIFLFPDGLEIARRRQRLPAGQFVEAWPDLYVPGLAWITEESRVALETATGPLRGALAIDADAVTVYYGPRLTELASLPAESSLKARVLSAHGVAVAWITLDRFGERVVHRVDSPLDPIFFLRRPGGSTTHQWRLFRTKPEAVLFMREHYGDDPEASEWANGLAVGSYDELLERHGHRETERGL